MENQSLIDLQTKILEIVDAKINETLCETTENQKTINMEIYNNVKNIFEQQEADSEKSKQNEINIQNLSKLVKYMSNDIEKLEKNNEALTKKITDQEYQLTYANTQTNTNFVTISNIIKQFETQLEDQSNEIKNKDKQIQILLSKINELTKKMEEIEKNLDKKIETHFVENKSLEANKINVEQPIQQTSFGIQKKNSNEYIVSAPSATSTETMFLQRLERACSHNLNIEVIYITPNTISCQIVGTTGNIYVANLVGVPVCSCLDYERNHHKCKHILYVLHKLLALDNVNRNLFTYEEINSAIKSKALAKKTMVIRSN